MKYFLVLAILFTFILSALETYRVLPEVNRVVEQARVQVLTAFPENLEIYAKDGSISTNQPEPYIVPVPQEFRDEMKNQESDSNVDIENFIVFDSDGTLDDIKTYKSLILINSANVLIQTYENGTEKIEVSSTKEVPNGTLNKAVFEENVIKFLDLSRFLPYVIFAGLFIVLFIFNVFIRMIVLSLLSLILMLVAMVAGISLRFQDLYKISVHTLTFSLIFEAIVKFFSVSFDVNLVSFLINLGLASIVVFSLRSKDQPLSPEPIVSNL